MSYEVMVGNKAAATAVKLARVQVSSAFPITPQTTITQYLSEMAASGDTDIEFVNVEGELSSQVVAQAASRVGVRAFTCTSGPGLQYMHHPVSGTGSSGLPLVMAVVHRGIKSMQPDHTDLMSQEWTGWIHLYVENAQEILDTVLMAYKIAEDPRVRRPVAVGYDGYVLSYTAEPVEIPDQKAVDDWLPPNKAMPSILPDEQDWSKPRRGFGGGDRDPQAGWIAHHNSLLGAEAVIKEVHADYAEKFGRSYGNGMLEEYKMDDVDVCIVAMGTTAGSAKAAVDKLQADGKKVGLIKLRSYIPFPEEDFKRIAKSVKAIGVVDRNICPGKGGAVYMQIRSRLYDAESKPVICQFYAGLSGKEIRVNDLVGVGETTLKAAKEGKAPEPIWV